MGTRIKRLEERLISVCLIMVVAVACSLLCTFLVSGVPTIFGIRPMIVVSGSMEPVLPVGSLVVTKAVTADKVEVGDVVGYWTGNRFIGINPIILHRVIAITEEGYLLKGDNNETADPIMKQERIIYRVVYPEI
ncbi:MAG: signal peptidase I [Lachnospiraceae bacterium]|nr:signal peptidase I [Lachnospiraceae bacterium]